MALSRRYDLAAVMAPESVKTLACQRQTASAGARALQARLGAITRSPSSGWPPVGYPPFKPSKSAGLPTFLLMGTWPHIFLRTLRPMDTGVMETTLADTTPCTRDSFDPLLLSYSRGRGAEVARAT